jgi:hypothetical protein
LFFLVSLLAFLAMPAINAVSRHFEHEADRYGVEVIHRIVADPNQVASHYFEKSGEMKCLRTRPKLVHESLVLGPSAILRTRAFRRYL